MVTIINSLFSWMTAPHHAYAILCRSACYILATRRDKTIGIDFDLADIVVQMQDIFLRAERAKCLNSTFST